MRHYFYNLILFFYSHFITYESNYTLKLIDAYVEQKSVVLQFNKNIKCSKKFDDIFESLNVTTEDPKVECRGDDKLLIHVNDDFPFREFFGRNANEKFIFKPNNQVTELGANSSLSIGIKEGLEVTFRRRGAKDLDTSQVCIIYESHESL